MFIYTALGDSITAGECASSPRKAYTQAVVDMLRTSCIQASGFVLAKPGWTSSQLLQTLSLKDPFPFGRSNVISIWIGGDNLIRAGLTMMQGAGRSLLEASLLQYRHDLGRTAAMLQAAGSARIVLCTQYNPFPHTPLAEKAVGQLNQTIVQVAKASGVELAPVHSWFQGKQSELIYGYRNGRLEDALLGKLPIHPNDKGHSVIARGLYPFLSEK